MTGLRSLVFVCSGRTMAWRGLEDPHNLPSPEPIKAVTVPEHFDFLMQFPVDSSREPWKDLPCWIGSSMFITPTYGDYWGWPERNFLNAIIQPRDKDLQNNSYLQPSSNTQLEKNLHAQLVNKTTTRRGTSSEAKVNTDCTSRSCLSRHYDLVLTLKNIV